jgi:hypothetical protein
VIPPVRSARLQDVFPYGNCTETRKIRRGTFTGFSHDWQPLGVYPVFSDLQAKGPQLRLLHRGTPSPAQRGIFRGSDVRRIQNYLSGEATRTFRYPRSQTIPHFEFSPELWLTAATLLRQRRVASRQIHEIGVGGSIVDRIRAGFAGKLQSFAVVAVFQEKYQYSGRDHEHCS